MTVACPRCATCYALPESLLGAAGARVRCPRCGERFEVGGPGGETSRPTTGSDAALDAALDGLSVVTGDRLAASHARGRLFGDHGPALCAAFEAYAAGGGDGRRFRAGLAERFGIRLDERD